MYGVGDRRTGRDDRRLTKADDTASELALRLPHVDDDFADIAQPGQLVRVEVRVNVAARRVVHDPLFRQSVGDAHDDTAVNLAASGQRIDDRAAVLHRDHLVDRHDAGFGIDRDVGHLNAADELARQTVVLRPLAFDLERHFQQPAGILPGADFLVVLPDAAAEGVQIVAVDTVLLSDLVIDLPESIECCPANRTADAADRNRTARRVCRRVFVTADVNLDRVQRQTQRLGQHHRNDGSGSGSQVLAAKHHLGRAIGMNPNAARRPPGSTTPAVHRDADSALDGAVAFALSGFVILVLPLHQLGSAIEFGFVHVRPRLREPVELIEILPVDLNRVHPQLSSQVRDRRVRQSTQLRVRWCPPGTVLPAVGHQTGRFDFLVLKVKNVRQLIPVDCTTLQTIGSPVVALPADNRAVLLRTYRAVAEARGPRARRFQFGRTIEHQLHGAPGILRHLS